LRNSSVIRSTTPIMSLNPHPSKGLSAVGIAYRSVADRGLVGDHAALHDPALHASVDHGDAAVLVLAGAHGLDRVEVEMAGRLVSHRVRSGGEVHLAIVALRQADPPVDDRGIPPEAVSVHGVDEVQPLGLEVLAEMTVGGDFRLDLVPEDDVAGVAGDDVVGHHLAADGLGELLAGALLVFEAYLVLAGLGLAVDGGPDADAEGAISAGHSTRRSITPKRCFGSP
jgi:hypothetical protein